jgi:hypothetical protein
VKKALKEEPVSPLVLVISEGAAAEDLPLVSAHAAR